MILEKKLSIGFWVAIAVLGVAFIAIIGRYN